MAEEFKKLPTVSVGDLDRDYGKAVVEGLKNKKEISQKAEEESTRLQMEYHDSTRRFKTLKNIQYRQQTKKSAEYQMGFVQNLDNAEDIQKSNEQWYNEAAREVARLGGEDQGERLNELSKYLQMANEVGLRIANDKTDDAARDGFEEKVRTFYAEIAKPNNLDGVKSSADDLQATLRLYESKGMLDQDELKGYDQRYGRIASSSVWNYALGSNEYITATKGSKEGLKHMKQMKEQLKDYYDILPDKNKALIEKRMKNLESTENDFPRQQYEFGSHLNNFVAGRGKVSDFKAKIADIKKRTAIAEKDENITDAGRVKIQIFKDQVSATEKIVTAIEDMSSTVESGRSLSYEQKALLDTRRSTADVANQLGISTDSEEYKFFRQMRLDMLKNTYVDGDPVETNKQIFKYLKNVGGPEKSSFRFSGRSSDPIKDFERMLAEDSNINVSMGGSPGRISKKTANQFMALYQDPRNQERLNELARKNPGLRPMIAKHRSKEQNYFDKGTQGVFNYFGGILNVNQASVQATITEISQNPKSKALYNRILDDTATYLDAAGKKQLDEVIRDTSFSRSDVLKALSLGVYKRLKEKDNGAISDSTLRSQLESKDTQTYRDVRKYTLEVLEEMSEGKKTIGRVPTWGDDNLNNDSDSSRAIIGVFSGRPGNFNKFLNTIGRAVDIGKKDITTLDPAGQRQLNSYLSGLMGQDRPNLQDHILKITHDGGTLYAIGIDRDDGSTDVLRDKFGNKIYIDTSLIDPNFKATNKNTASMIIGLIRKSNVSDAL